MSFETIQIFHDFPIVNDHVQVPPNQENDKQRVSVDEALMAIPGAEEIFLSQGSGKNTGSKFGAQRFLRLPPLAPGESFAVNPVDLLASS